MPTKAKSVARAVPSGIDSPQAKLVYLYVERERETTVDALADALDVSKLGLLTVLSTLETAGHVERSEDHVVRIAD